jgi:hypothetical protein
MDKKKQISLGFQFSVADEIRMYNAIAAAKKFMKSYGKGITISNSYGRIISSMRGYQTRDN